MFSCDDFHGIHLLSVLLIIIKHINSVTIKVCDLHINIHVQSMNCRALIGQSPESLMSLCSVYTISLSIQTFAIFGPEVSLHVYIVHYHWRIATGAET